MVKEMYMQIDSYENYAVSNFGNVKNITTGKILKGIDKGNGYLEVGIYRDKKLKKVKIHQLVANNFLKKTAISEMINHINGIKIDNRVENLEWVTNRENSCHKSKLKESTSKYIGVHFRHTSNRWISQININRKTKHLGSFKTEIEAYQCRVDFESGIGIINRYL